MAYQEKDDFNLHKYEVETFFDVLSQSNCSEKLDKVLDFGAGQGMHIGFLQDKAGHVIAADIINYSELYDGQFFKLLREKYERNQFQLDLSRVSFIESNGMDLIFKDEMFDACVSFNVFEHIPDPKKGLEELVRVTKPGGLIYITFDPIWTSDSGGHFFHLVPEPWAHLVKSEEEYIKLMKESHASDNDVKDFKFAMNKVRLGEFKQVFEEVTERFDCEVMFFSSWSGTVHPENPSHHNFKVLVDNGYTEEELLTRGLRYLIRKSH